jgi:hypothetical protein
MTGEVLVMLALFEQLMAGITQRCPHVACRRRQACSGKKDVCAMAPLDPRTRARPSRCCASVQAETS